MLLLSFMFWYIDNVVHLYSRTSYIIGGLEVYFIVQFYLRPIYIYIYTLCGLKVYILVLTRYDYYCKVGWIFTNGSIIAKPILHICFATIGWNASSFRQLRAKFLYIFVLSLLDLPCRIMEFCLIYFLLLYHTLHIISAYLGEYFWIYTTIRVDADS